MSPCGLLAAAAAAPTALLSCSKQNQCVFQPHGSAAHVDAGAAAAAGEDSHSLDVMFLASPPAAAALWAIASHSQP